jgi:hypothetical protein
MSKNEIKGLQQLAMAHGGSLTINPDTGLVEAGFLEQALPIVAAAAATYFTAGAAAPALSAALGSTMAGGIAAGALAGAGISGLTAAATGKDAGKAALMGGLGGALAGGIGAYGDAGSVGAEATQKAAIEGGTAAIAPTPAPAGGTPSSPVDYNAGLSGTSPTVPTPPPAPNTPITPSQLSQGVSKGTYTMDQANQYGKAFTDAYTNAPAAPPPSYYQGLEPNGVGRGMVQMLPAAGLLDQQPKQPTGPGAQEGIGVGLSPNFQRYEPQQPNPYYKARYANYQTSPYAEGGEIRLAGGGQPTGPVEQMTQNMMGGQSNMYPQSQQDSTQFATPSQMPASAEIIRSDYDTKTNPYSGGIMMKGGGLPADAPKLRDVDLFTDTDPSTRGLSALDATTHRNKKLMDRVGIKMAEMPKTGIKSLGGDFSDVGAAGGTLGGYSDGGRMLKGPGDGMSDSIPAQIGRKQPARLADGEFVVPADVVSHLGNGSTDAGAKKLYSMMDKIRRARTGKKKQAPAVKADKFMPA